eukprot:COSAG06_NODE_2164_length_7436_cov_5.989778_6_plen_168_part_01
MGMEAPAPQVQEALPPQQTVAASPPPQQALPSLPSPVHIDRHQPVMRPTAPPVPEEEQEQQERQERQERQEQQGHETVRFASSEGRRRPKQEMLTAHISGLTSALKTANSLLMECQSTLIAEREASGKQVALLRARGAGHRICAAERATRAAAQLSAAEARTAEAQAE